MALVSSGGDVQPRDGPCAQRALRPHDDRRARGTRPSARARENLRQFLFELGRDFCFVGEEIPSGSDVLTRWPVGARRPWQIFVELQSQATFALGGIGLGAGKSSAADAAAKAMTARTSSSVRLGNSARIVANVSPWAR